MTQASRQANPYFGAVRADSIGEMRHGLYEADSQSFLERQFVYLNSGAVTVVATDGTLVYGMAETDATNVTSGNAEIVVSVILPGDEIIMPCTNNGTDSTSDNFVAGTAYGLHVANNVTYADLNDTTNDCVVFIEPLYDEDGDEIAWGKFKLLPSACQAVTGQ